MEKKINYYFSLEWNGKVAYAQVLDLPNISKIHKNQSIRFRRVLLQTGEFYVFYRLGDLPNIVLPYKLFI